MEAVMLEDRCASLSTEMLIMENETRVVIAGFGGQGVVSAGAVMTYGCMAEGKTVTAMMSYGAEMRGGTANSTVVISDGEISSPFVEHPNVAIIMNRPSLDKFEPMMTSGGIVIANSSLVDRQVERGDIKTVNIEATRIAHELGNVRVANMVALGAFARITKLLSQENLVKALEQTFSSKKPGLVEINIQAIQAGFDSIKE